MFVIALDCSLSTETIYCVELSRPFSVSICDSMAMQRHIPGTSFPFVSCMFFFYCSVCSALTTNNTYTLSSVELDTMSQICASWKDATPEAWEGDLGSWCGPNEVPCVPSKPWNGLRCLQKQLNGSSQYAVYIVHFVVTDDAILRGTVLPAFGNLTNLASLTVERNPHVHGTIPDLSKLRSLNTIKFGRNNMSGSIPRSIASSTVLQYIDLSENKFSGEIPNDLLSKTNGLQTLNVSDNLLSGDLNQSMFQNQPSLIQLDFSKNQFSGYFPKLASSLQYLDVSVNNFIGSFPTSSSLQYMNLSYNQYTGEVQESMISNMTLLETLDLSHNGFTGSLPNLNSLPSLKSLNLGHNDFEGGIFPDWIANLPQLETLSFDNISIHGFLNISRLFSNTTLRSLTMQDNDITDIIYFGYVKDLKTVNIKLQGNPFCKKSTSKIDLKRCVCQQICYDSGQSRTDTTKIILIVTTISGAVLIMIIIVSTILLRKTKKQKYELMLEAQKKFTEYEVKPTLFTYNELRTASKDFHQSMELGEGGYGIVYKGCLSNGDEVAIKKLFNSVTQRNTDDFLNEVVLLTSVKHRNLVSLKGCCLQRKQRLLVYEYVKNYDLAQVLFEHRGNFNLDWSKRMKICLDIANGLHYLHSFAEPRIIHRDVKANNILLDDNFQAKIADFGLALLFPDEKSDIMTMHVAGTRGYLAPEYATLGQLSEKVDVFSFGILLLEIVSGRKIIDLKLLPYKAYLLEWAKRSNDNGNIADIIDPKLHLHIHEEIGAQQVIKIALCCSQLDPERRPTMARVVAMLQGDIDIEIVISEKQLSYDGLIREEYLDNCGLKVEGNIVNGELECKPMLAGSLSSCNPSTYIELSELLNLGRTM